jgi:hypothetical protein
MISIIMTKCSYRRTESGECLKKRELLHVSSARNRRCYATQGASPKAGRSLRKRELLHVSSGTKPEVLCDARSITEGDVRDKGVS